MICFWACAFSTLFVQAHAQHAAHLCEGGDRHFRRLQAQDTSLLNTIKVCEMQVMYVQKMTKEYLLSASYVEAANLVEAAQNKQAMLDTIGLFNTKFLALFSGSLSLTYASTATDEYTVQNQWTLLKPKWESYSAYLQANVSSLDATSSASLAQLEMLGQAVMDHSQLALDKYIAYATLVGKVLPPVPETFARRQAMQMQKVMKEALFISLHFKKESYLMALTTTERILEDVQSALSYGNIVADVPEATKMCTLHAMLKVSKAFALFKKDLGKITDTQAVSRTLLFDMTPKSKEVDEAMESALVLFEVDDGTCDAVSSVDDEGWAKLLAETNMQRYLSQKATRIFLEIAKGVDVDKYKIILEQALADAQASLVKCMKGSHIGNIPAPVTQAIADALMLTWEQWQLFEFEVRHSGSLGDYSTSTVGKVGELSKSVSDHMRKVGNMCVLAATTAKPALRNLVWEVSQRQLTLLEKMFKEALLVTLGQSVAANRAAFEFTVSAFEGSHSELLLGRPSSNGTATNSTNSTAALEVMVFEHNEIPRTTDACTLTVMATVMNRFDDFKALLQRLMDNITDSAAVTTAIRQLDSLSHSAIASMTLAIAFYNAGQGNCSTTLSEDVWAVSIQQTGRMQYMIQKSLTEYYLLASGFWATWMDQSLAALEAHKGFIMENSASPRLAIALTAFKTAWDSYSSAVEETSLGLQVAYITLNPNPLGSKDVLDFADLPQQYHKVHAEQHPYYRAILYEKDYYDIFMLDLEGNLIYSVYKENDYATNFAANGFGRWRASGLGEAFEAAMAQPDELHVIDWKPYGPSYGALASFLSIGVRESTNRSIGTSGQVIGVYCTQLPPSSKPIDSKRFLDDAITEIDQLLIDFKFGKPSIPLISAPPTQAIADRLFSVFDTWALVHGVVTANASDNGMIQVGNQDVPLTSASEMLMQSFVDGARTGAPILQGTKVAVASMQLAAAQSMGKFAVLIGAGSTDFANRNGLAAKMAAFETNQLLLVDGNSTGRRLQAATTAVQPCKASSSCSLLDSAYSSWLALKPTLQSIVDGGSATEDVLKDVVSGTAGLVSSMDEVFMFFSSTTLTTTLIALEILAPMPFTGKWAAGPTMKVSSLLAMGLINEQQLILPGYHLKSAFFDDKCDNAESSRIVLREMAAKDTYIALGGAGCSEVCSQTAFTASTIRLPFLSYECPAASLSDVVEYPDFTRFGTVTTDTAKVIKIIGSNFSWPAITVISGDTTTYGPEAQRMQSEFTSAGFTSTITEAFEDDWPGIVSMMALLKGGSAGQKRVYFLVGSEDYLRKVICASILSGANEGITWLSQGTWSDTWWSKSDKLAGFHLKWILEDVGGDQLKQATADFIAAWDGFAADDEERRTGLTELYMTDEKDNLDVAVNSTGPMVGPYHAAHIKWHPIYRAILYSRLYYDIFIFDIRGNLIYSVYKESDYATNFAATRPDDLPLGEWVNSGLGKAFRIGIESPNNVSYIDWSPYGPSAGALAAFISTSIRDKEGVVIGVYTIQLPPDYERSIEELQPACSLQAITESFEGAINVAGLGKPTEADSVKPLTCFDGHSARSFSEMLDRHLEGGYPIGDLATQVISPYTEVKAHAADAICTLAFTVKHLLSQGYSIEEIQNPDPMLYAKFLEYVKTEIDFQGASGRVKFEGNDRPNYLGVQQVHNGMKVDVGVVSPHIADETPTIEWTNGGPDGSMWKREAPEPDDFPWRILQVGIPAIVCCVPTIVAIISGRRDA